jgi:hypothetical protein
MSSLPAAILAIAVGLTPGIAQAHGGGPGLSYDPCMQQNAADDFVHMAVYQPQFNPFAEFCDALPKAGPTLLVFDLIGAELSDAPVSLEVVQKDGPLHLTVPAHRYRSGVAELRADLPLGKYTVLVTIDEAGSHGHLAFPLRVGIWWDRVAGPLAAVLLILGVTAGYCTYQIRGIASQRRNLPRNNPIELRRA